MLRWTFTTKFTVEMTRLTCASECKSSGNKRVPWACWAAAALRRSLNVIDHRPRKVFVQGMDEGDKENLQAHFAQYGEVEGVEILNSGLVITFKTRKDAELGVSQGAEFKNRPLQWAWFKEPSRTASTGDAATPSTLTQDELAADEESNLALEEDLLLVDDEEEEDSEARSWRR